MDGLHIGGSNGRVTTGAPSDEEPAGTGRERSGATLVPPEKTRVVRLWHPIKIQQVDLYIYLLYTCTLFSREAAQGPELVIFLDVCSSKSRGHVPR